MIWFLAAGDQSSPIQHSHQLRASASAECGNELLCDIGEVEKGAGSVSPSENDADKWRREKMLKQYETRSNRENDEKMLKQYENRTNRENDGKILKQYETRSNRENDERC